MLRSSSYFSDPVTPIMWGIVSLHDHILLFLICILVVVLSMFYGILISFYYGEDVKKDVSGKITPIHRYFIKERIGRNLHVDWEKDIEPPFIPEEIARLSLRENLYYLLDQTRAGKEEKASLIQNYADLLYYYCYHDEQLKTGNKVYTWSSLRHGMELEIVWTLIPSYILLLIAIPSFALLFAIDEAYTYSLVVKIVGHQWYWSYETTNFGSYLVEPTVEWLMQFTNDPAFFLIITAETDYFNWLLETIEWTFKSDMAEYNISTLAHNFDSYMLSESDLVCPELRLLKTDNALILPQSYPITLIITSDDVLHSWSVQRFGIKVDAVPGRLSQASLLVEISGKYYGQCSELCGVNHGFMPIEVWVIDVNLYNNIFK